MALAKVLLSDNNFLILDEPTNFLDIESIEVLEKFLKLYNGTLLFATHDRNFIDKIATNILLIEEHKFIEFDGNYSKYLEYKNNKDKQKNNNRLLLEFKLSELDTRIALEKDEKKKAELEKQYMEIKCELNK